MARAVFAEPDEREVGEVRLVAELFPNGVAHRVESFWRDRGHLCAALAVEVLDLVAAEQRVEPGSVTEMDVTHDAKALERFEVAVDR